jgi:hypothetical protein
VRCELQACEAAFYACPGGEETGSVRARGGVFGPRCRMWFNDRRPKHVAIEGVAGGEDEHAKMGREIDEKLEEFERVLRENERIRLPASFRKMVEKKMRMSQGSEPKKLHISHTEKDLVILVSPDCEFSLCYMLGGGGVIEMMKISTPLDRICGKY